MATRYFCRDEGRRAATLRSALNGIDFVEVSADQRTLHVRFLKPELPTGLAASWVRVEGGVRVRGIAVRVVRQQPGVLEVDVDRPGDFSLYTLRLVDPNPPAVPAPNQVLLDRRLAAAQFSFKAACATDFDCRADTSCPPAPVTEPELSYLAKDYASFRRLMLDRLSVVAPRWRERHPADLGVALVELCAYVGDHLSYYQDAVASEAYLAAARKRVSVRRHARLVDYRVGEGCNARAFVVFTATAAADGMVLPGPDFESGRPGTRLLAGGAGQGDAGPIVAPDQLAAAVARGAIVFETMHDLTLRARHEEIPFYTWSDGECCLPAGATAATLEPPDGAAPLRPGDLLLFEEVVGPATGDPADADPRHRHVVRLTTVKPLRDEVTGRAVVDVAWHPTDALPFALCLSAVSDDAHGAKPLDRVSVARGNVALADHGMLGEEELAPVTAARFRPALRRVPLTFASPLPAGFSDQPAAVLVAGTPREARPQLMLVEKGSGERWHARPDLLASDRFARELVVEVEEDGETLLRFGDDRHGQAPNAGTAFVARYRVGNGPDGNLGAGTLRRVVLPAGLGANVTAVRNPLPAGGGQPRESLEEVRQFAPQAFRVQQRAVTAEDYAAAAERHPEVQRAAATIRFTGSWFTVFVGADRKGGAPVDAAFERELRRHLEPFRMAGYDLEIEAPRFVALDLALRVCVLPGYLRGHVRAALRERLGSRDLAADGGRGLFHPDEWTFGQPVYLSRLYAAAAAVAGVGSLEVMRLARRGEPQRPEVLAAGVLPIGRLEIARLDDDANRQENGRLELLLEGGR